LPSRGKEADQVAVGEVCIIASEQRPCAFMVHAHPGAAQNSERRVMDDLALLAVQQAEAGDGSGVDRHQWNLPVR
jgi:hypothetical protein